MRRLPFLAALITLAAAAPASAQDEIVVLNGSADEPTAQEVAQREQALDFNAEHEYDQVIDGFAADLTDAQVAELERDPEVAYVVPNRPVRKSGVVAAVDPTTVPPGIHRVTKTTSTGVRQAASGAVAVLDTGVDLEHPDLNVAAGKNCVTPAASPDDTDGHGTHVAGTIGAKNDSQGVTGVAPGTKIYAVKVLDDAGNGTTATILCGAEWVLNNASSRNITVANFSLGGPGVSSTCASDPEHAVFCALANAKIVPVVAAGNDGVDFGATSTREVPASYPQVLTVTAMNDTDGRPGALGGSCSTTPDDRYATFSNYATKPADDAHTVAAPGVCIRSTYPGSRYARMSGTSMAAPHVAGLVALCKGEASTPGPCANLTTPQVIARMRMADSWSSFTGLNGRLFGPLSVISDPAAPTPAPTPIIEDEPAPAKPPATKPTPDEPTETPTDQPAPAPPQTTLPLAPAPTLPAAPPIRSSRPSLSLVTPRLQTLRTKGLRAKLACPTDCLGTITLEVTKATARRLKLKSTTLAAAYPEQAGTVALRPSKAVRRRLAKTRKAFKVEIVAEIEIGDRVLRSAKALTIRP